MLVANEDDMNRAQPTDQQTGADTGFSTDVGVASPGSPADEMGLDVPTPSNDVGAADPGGMDDLTGQDQEHDRGDVSDREVPLADALRPRLVEDSEPDRSNFSSPTGPS